MGLKITAVGLFTTLTASPAGGSSAAWGQVPQSAQASAISCTTPCTPSSGLSSSLSGPAFLLPSSLVLFVPLRHSLKFAYGTQGQTGYSFSPLWLCLLIRDLENSAEPTPHPSREFCAGSLPCGLRLLAGAPSPQA